MKIGILTFHRAINYGAVLQCYGLSETLKAMGHEVDVIDYRPECIEYYRKKIPFFKIRHTSGLRNQLKALIVSLLNIETVKDANRRFDLFLKNNFNLSKTVLSAENMPSDYDLIFLGSDQIWSPQICYGFDSIYWGQFKHDTTRLVTYAASLGGHNELSDLEWKNVGRYLKGFERISVREKKLQEDSTLPKEMMDFINDIISGNISDEVRDKIKKSLQEYLNSDEIKNRIKSSISGSIDTETKKELLKIVRNEVEKSGYKESVRKEISEEVEKIISEEKKKLNLPTVHIINLHGEEIGRTDAEHFHEKFEEILSLVNMDEPVMLIGPAGSGKNYSIAQVSKALNKHMYYTNNASNEFKLTGFIDAGGNYRDTEFYKAFKNGGVFFLDEIDNSDPSALIVINSALANGYMAFPHETIDRHPDFRMVAAANTWGRGSDFQYVGRNALDASTLDRFDNVFFDYDMALEEKLYPNDSVLDFMWAFRDAVEKSRIPHIVSTRGIGKVYKKEISGFSPETTLRVNVIRNLSQDDLNVILGNMEKLKNNKYYEACKKLIIK